MFSGIVEEKGEVRSRDGHRLALACRRVLDGSEVGASVAVNGVCLTVVDRGDGVLGFDLSDETLARSGLSRLGPGDAVNLERPITLASRLGGHLVQGHVDGVGRIARIAHGDDQGARIRVSIPGDLLPFVVEKGSIAIDGVSLTVADLHADGATFAVIPHTLVATTLGTASPDDPVNVEVDVIARYVDRLLAAHTPTDGSASDLTDEGRAER